MLTDAVVNGITAGSVYALVAVGMTIIFGVLRAINFAHGEFYMLGTFGAWWGIETLDLPYIVSIPLALIIVATIALAVGVLVMKRLIDQPFQIGIVATLGVSLVLQNAVILIFGGAYKMFDGGWIEPVEILGVSLSEQRILIVVAALAIFGLLELVVHRTRFGKTIRAVSQNIEACKVVGVNVPAVVIGTFVLGCTLAALSGVLTAPVTVSLYGGMGTSITVKTFAIIVMGGVGNVSGTLFAAWLLGLMESFVASYLGLQFRDAVAFTALIAVLTFLPGGLFSKRERF
ncbi:MAG: branched-chain amino acid transport system / permease component family protein [Rhodopila sp.]|nr:branched-chain amino acid transport system / permease component family protein [Rhodopila sp.]